MHRSPQVCRVLQLICCKLLQYTCILLLHCNRFRIPGPPGIVPVAVSAPSDLATVITVPILQLGWCPLLHSCTETTS